MRAKKLAAAAACKTALAFTLVGLMAAATAQGDIVGFNNGANYTLLANPNATTAGAPAFTAPEVLEITNMGLPNGQATAAWYNTRQDITTFQAKFDYTMAGYDTWTPADGIVFVMQNDGLNALGAAGGSRGYTGSTLPFDPLALSAGVSFNIYDGVLSGTSSDVQTAANGAFGASEQTAPVDLISGNPIRTNITYDGSTVYVDLVDLNTGDEFSTQVPGVPVDLLVGDSQAYVGFTGGTGGANAIQEITNFSYTQAPILIWDGLGPGDWRDLRWVGSPPNFPDIDTIAQVNANVVTVGTADEEAFRLDVTGGGIAVGAGRTLTVKHGSAFAAGSSLDLAAGATIDSREGLNLAAGASLTMADNSAVITPSGNLGDVSTAGTAIFDIGAGARANSLTASAGVVTKRGDGLLTLDSTGGAVSAAAATLKVEAGELKTAGPDPLGGSTSVHLAGGKLTIDGGGFGTGSIAPGDLSNFTFTGSATDVAGELSLANAGNQAGNAFYNDKQDITKFSVEFDYRIADSSDTPADEWCFIVQNNAAGAGATGGRGHTGMADSAAVLYNIWQNSEQWFATNGGRPGNGTGQPTAPVDLRLTNTVHTRIDYNGATLSVSMEDLTTGATFSNSQNIDIAGTIGATDGLGYLGFGGGTGGAWADMRIMDFTNNIASYPIDQQRTAVLVSQDSTLNPVTTGSAAFGPLTMLGGTLTTSGASGGISFRASPKAKAGDTTIDPSATHVGFDPRVPTDYGVIDASNAVVEISKEGPGTWVLAAQPLNLNPGATWTVNDGIMELQGTDPLDSLPITVSGGLLRMQGGDKLASAPLILDGGRTQITDGRGGFAGDITAVTQEGVGTDDFTLNTNSAGVVPSIVAPGVLEMTTSANNQATSAFYNTPQDVRAFRVEFDYTMTDAGTAGVPADGMGLVFQNSQAGLNALGWGGGGMGYQRLIPESAGVMFNIYPNVGNASGSDLQLGVNGQLDDWAFRATSPLSLASGNPIHAAVIYDGRDITVEMEDTVTGSTYSTVFANVDIPYLVGEDTAYIGFTGATGGANATQHISNLSNQFTSTPINTAGINVTVTDSSVLEVNTHGAAPFGSLTMVNGNLTTTGAFLGGISFTGTSIDPAATAVGFDPEAPTDYGPIDAGNAAVTISKTGNASHWTLAAQPGNLSGAASWRVEGGTMELQGVDPIGGLPITVAGGLLTMVGGDQLGGAPVTLAGGKLQIKAPAAAPKQITGFGDGSSFTLNATAAAAELGFPNITNDTLAITSVNTDPGRGSATSAFHNERQDVGEFHVEFDYQMVTGTARPADGAAFVIQNAGLTALGGGGGGIGYTGIPDSVALIYNIWDGWPVGIGLARNGVLTADDAGTYQDTDNIDLRSSDVIHSELDYDGTTLSVAMEDLTTGETYARTYAVDIPGTVDGSGAYVGFTGGTGGAASTQHITSFSMSFAASAAIERTDINILVTGDSALDAATHSSATFGDLTMQNGVLSVMGAFTGGVSFAKTDVDPAATAVGFNPQRFTHVDLGVVDGQNAAAMIAKTGTGHLLLDKVNVNLQNATFDVQGGQLIGKPAEFVDPPTNPFEGADFRMGGGNLILAARATGEDVTYGNDMYVDATSTLTGGTGGFGAPGPVTVTLGNATLGVALNNGTLRMDSTDDYKLNVASPFSGPGDLEVTGGEVNLGGGGSANLLTLSGGKMTLETAAKADLNVTDMEIAGGTGDTGDSAVVVGNNFRVAPNNFTMVTPPDTFAITGEDLATSYNVVLSSGIVSVKADGGGGDIVGFGDGASFTLNGNQLPAVPNIVDDTLQITSLVDNQQSSCWFNTPQDVNEIGAEFVWQLVPPEGNPADGTTFTIQNAGLGAIGGGGGNLGYNGIADSVALAINIYDPDPFDPGIALFQSGAVVQTYMPTAPVNLRSTNPIYFLLEYDQTTTTLDVSLEDTVTGDQFSTSFTVDIRQLVGDVDTAFFGFTGATGGLNADQQISGFTNALQTSPILAQEANIVAVGDATLNLITVGDAVLGDFRLDPGVTLTVAGAAAQTKDIYAGHNSTLDGSVGLRGHLYAGDSPGLLNVHAPNSAFEFFDEATYDCEIAQWDSTNVPDPWVPMPPASAVNDRLHMTAGDVFLAGTLELSAIEKLHPRFMDPVHQVEVEWFGDQTRIILSASGENTVAFEFENVPDPQPESWDTIMTGTEEWSQGHIGRGAFLTRQNDGGPNDVPGISFGVNATKVHLFQAADGDTNGDRNLGGRDIQNIQSFALFGLTEDPGDPFVWPPDWSQGDFDGDGLVTGLDISAILATGLWPTSPYAAIDPGEPLDGVVDLLLYPEDVTLEDGTVVPAGTVMIDPDGLTLNGYVLRSDSGIFTGAPAQQLNWFFVEDTDRQISGNMGAELSAVQDLGAVVGPEWTIINPFEKQDVNPFDDLTLTYTVVGTPGTFVGNLIIVPEPGTVALLLSGALGLLLWAVRRRRKA